MKRSWKKLWISCLLILLLFVTGCNGQTSARSQEAGEKTASDSGESTAEAWDSTPQVLVPEAPGTSLMGNSSIEIDVSNISQGYLMARYVGNGAKVKFFIETPDQVRYTYDLPASQSYAALPLTAGNGTYTLDVREHVEGDLYSNLYMDTIDVSIDNEFSPFLYPNQYTWFTQDSQTVSKASDLTRGVKNGLEAVGAVYDFVITNISYDEEKARTVESGYLPDVDETLESGKGICFDYAALMTAMLRSQGIPTKLEIGYSGEVYHAWISTWLKEKGWVENIIEFDGKNWSLIDPTLAAGNKPSSVKKYIGDDSNYTLMYSR